MSGRSVFSGVARNENSHTELLGNLLRYSLSFQSFFLQFVSGAEFPAGQAIISTQFQSEGDGRPDLVFDFQGARKNVVVELRVRPSCASTHNQTAGPGEAGYRHLGDVYFLVPKHWVHRSSIAGPVRTWEDLALSLSRASAMKDDLLLREYLKLLDLEFPSIRFSDEERTMLGTSGARLTVSAAIKLHRTVDSLAERFKEVGYRVEASADEGEYGFYIRARETNRYLLWVGMWSSYDLLLGVGVESHWLSGQVLNGFIPTQDSHWQVYSLNEIILAERSDVVETAFQSILSVLSELGASPASSQP